MGLFSLAIWVLFFKCINIKSSKNCKIINYDSLNARSLDFLIWTLGGNLTACLSKKSLPEVHLALWRLPERQRSLSSTLRFRMGAAYR